MGEITPSFLKRYFSSETIQLGVADWLIKYNGLICEFGELERDDIYILLESADTCCIHEFSNLVCQLPVSDSNGSFVFIVTDNNSRLVIRTGIFAAGDLPARLAKIRPSHCYFSCKKPHVKN